MLEKSLFRCDQNCNKCQNSCESKPSIMDMNIFFERIISELDILSLDIAINLIQVIDSIRDSDSEKILFIATCIETTIKSLLVKLNKKDLSILQTDSNLNDFLYHISNRMIELNKKSIQKGEENEINCC